MRCLILKTTRIRRNEERERERETDRKTDRELGNIRFK